MMEAARTFETSVDIQLRTRQYIPEDSELHYLVVSEARERLAVRKRPVNKMDVARFNLKKLNEGKVKEKY
jgi:hypothetical protein